MSDELMNRARELLALRDKATQIDGAVFNRYAHGGGRLYNEIAGKRKLIVDCFYESDREFFFAAHKMADTISDLMARVERLEGLAKRIDAERSYAVNRAKAAESQLRELCEQEPVAWIVESQSHFGTKREATLHGNDAEYSATCGDAVSALIPRPSMEKN